MIDTVKSVFIVGIKGVAMANIAIMMKQMGMQVKGCDVAEEFITDETLRNAGIVVLPLDTSLPDDTDLVLYAAAHGGSENAIVRTAKEKGVSVLHQVEAISQLMDMHEVKIAVCGSHGKTTTTSLMAHSLQKLGVNPSYLIGSSSFGDQPGGHFGDKKYIVVEADEYAMDPPRDKSAKFLHLNPTHILCTNIDFDHPDVFENIEAVKKTFMEFFTNSKAKIFACADDTELMNTYRSLPTHNGKTYGSKDADIPLIDETVLSQGNLYGKKNQLNATGVSAVLQDLGFTSSDIQQAVQSFRGVKRRFELVARIEEKDMYLFDDYAHHPNEINATVSAARMRFPGKRVIVLFQPHTFSRTQALKSEFVSALATADLAFIAPIFGSAREQAQTITSEELVSMAHSKGVSTIESFDPSRDITVKIAPKLRPGDVIFTMGAGDIYKAKNDIIKAITTA
jgi:UDP-N-acetylmuramate--alanine ligase